MIIKAELDGEEQEFELLGPHKGEATHHIADGRVWLGGAIGYVARLRLIRRHEFGGVVFEETGEVRCAENEWILLGGDERLIGYTVEFFRGQSEQTYRILRIEGS